MRKGIVSTVLRTITRSGTHHFSYFTGENQSYIAAVKARKCNVGQICACYNSIDVEKE